MMPNALKKLMGNEEIQLVGAVVKNVNLCCVDAEKSTFKVHANSARWQHR